MSLLMILKGQVLEPLLSLTLPYKQVLILRFLSNGGTPARMHEFIAIDFMWFSRRGLYSLLIELNLSG